MKFRTGLALLLVSFAAMFCFSCASVVNSSPIILTEFLPGAVEGMPYSSNVCLSDEWGIEPFHVTITGLPVGFHFSYSNYEVTISGMVCAGLSAQSPYQIRVLVEGMMKRWDSRNYTLYIMDTVNGPGLDLAVDPPTQNTQNEVLFTAENIHASTLAGSKVSDVYIDLTPLKGAADVAMVDDGTSGDVTADDGIYSVSYMLPLNIPTFTYDIRAYVVDNYNIVGYGETALEVIGGPKIGNLILAPWIEGYAGSHTFSVNGGATPYNWTISIDKPAWLSIEAATGKILGTPPAGSVGLYQFTVGISDVDGLTDEETVVLEVTPAPTTFLCICPPELHFGTAEFAVEPIELEMKVTNCIGVDIINITNISITGTDAADFIINDLSGIEDTILPFNMNPNEFFALSIFFYPQTASPADKEAELVIDYEDMNGNTYQDTINMYGAVQQTLTPIYTQDFEADDGGFTGTIDWEWGQPNYAGGPTAANSGTNVWGTNLSGNNDSAAHSFGTAGASGDYYLRSPSISASGLGAIIISYWQWFKFNGTAEDIPANTEGIWQEGGNLATTDGTMTNWDNIDNDSLMPRYNLTTDFTTTTPPPADCLTGDGGYWKRQGFIQNLNVGPDAQFQFVIGNDGVNGGIEAGWYIDDIVIYNPEEARIGQPELDSPEFCEVILDDMATIDVEFEFYTQFPGYTYEIVIGTEADLSDGQVLATGTTSGSMEYETVTLDNNVKYFWRVDISDGVDVCQGKIQCFTLTAGPGMVGDIYPVADTHFYTSATTLDVPMRWYDAEGADSYNVYIGSTYPLTSPANAAPVISSGMYSDLIVTFDLSVSMTWFVQVEAVNADGTCKSVGMTYYFDTLPTNIVINEVITASGENTIEIANFNDFPVYIGGWEIEVYTGAPGVSQGIYAFPTDDPMTCLTPWETSGPNFEETGIITVEDSSSAFGADYAAAFDFGWTDNSSQLEIALRINSTDALDYVALNQSGVYTNDPFANWTGEIVVVAGDTSIYRMTTTDNNNETDWASHLTGSIQEHNAGQ